MAEFTLVDYDITITDSEGNVIDSPILGSTVSGTLTVSNDTTNNAWGQYLWLVNGNESAVGNRFFLDQKEQSSVTLDAIYIPAADDEEGFADYYLGSVLSLAIYDLKSLFAGDETPFQVIEIGEILSELPITEESDSSSSSSVGPEPEIALPPAPKTRCQLLNEAIMQQVSFNQ